MKKYFTTAISYVNGKPHLGHAYEAILTDTFSRYNRLFGNDVIMLTGVDEHGKKVYDAASEKGLSPQEYCDSLIPAFMDLLKLSDVDYNIFFRTTDSNHKKNVQAILQRLYNNGDIYKGSYEGNYCVSCETFYTEKDLIDGKCPECGRETSLIKEENYMFNTEKYAEKYEKYLMEHDDFVYPKYRRNEVLGILKKGLRPLCISRKKEKMPWGIELPFDKDFVTYVWFDALTNYINGIGYLSDEDKFNSFWENAVHNIGKDILLHHCIYWPTMLMAMGLSLPKSIVIHGFWMGEGGIKMSKSLGNVIDPVELINKYGASTFRFYVLREMSLGHDGVFTKELFIKRNNNELANDFGNLINRGTHLIAKNYEGIIPTPASETKFCPEFKQQFKETLPKLQTLCDNFELNKLLDEIMRLIRLTNKYLENTAPWKLVKEDKEKCGTVLYNSLEAVRLGAILLSPVIPGKFKEVKALFPEGFSDEIEFGKLESGKKVLPAKALFPKLELEETKGVPAKSKKELKVVNEDNLIDIEDFGKVEIRTGKIIEAEKVEDSDRLLYTTVDFGPLGKRKIIAGIAKYYQPEEIVNKIILAATNLKPAKIRGLASEGMLLSIKVSKKIQLLVQNHELPLGKKLV